MLSKTFWMVRAGERGFRFDDFKEKALVSVGWLGVGELKTLVNRNDFKNRLTSVFPEWSPYEVGNSAGQLYRFAREARYEAERAAIPLTLMDLDDFVHSLLEHYEKLDVDMQRLIPLRKIYWPV